MLSLSSATVEAHKITGKSTLGAPLAKQVKGKWLSVGKPVA
ncbi:MAG: hypothetical protein ACPG3V_03055 [Porticoccaceae bacterium]